MDSAMKPYTQDDFRIAEEAANWLLRLEEDDTPECHAEFVAWTKLSARNVHEFLFVKAAFKELDGIDPKKKIDLSTLIGTAEIVQHPKSASSTQQYPALLFARAMVHRRRVRIFGVAAAVCAAAFGWLLFSHESPARPPVYTTTVGDQTAVKLPDGSVMHLNTRSRAQLNFSAQAREIRLLEGEALFVVEHDTQRPFRVVTDNATVQAIGTQFNVYRHAGATRVSVVEGAVQVSRASQKGVKLVAGDEAEVTRTVAVKTTSPDIQRAVAWRTRRLVFREDRLDHIVEEFNRYNRAQIRVEGAAVAERQMSGVFDADDPQTLLRFLANDPTLLMDKQGQSVTIRTRE